MKNGVILAGGGSKTTLSKAPEKRPLWKQALAVLLAQSLIMQGVLTFHVSARASACEAGGTAAGDSSSSRSGKETEYEEEDEEEDDSEGAGFGMEGPPKHFPAPLRNAITGQLLVDALVNDHGGVDLVQNNLTQSATDYVSASASAGAGGAEAVRVYNSNSSTHPAQTTIPMGAGWRNNYDQSLQVLSAAQVRLHRASGRTVDFTLSGGAWTAQVPAGVLTQSGGAWQYVSPGNAVEQYGANGRLQSISREGVAQTLQYDGAGRLATVLSPSGRNTSYLYNAAGRVSQVNLPGGL